MAWLSMELIERWFRRSQLGVARFGIGWLGIGALLGGLALLAAPSAGSTIATSIGSDQAASRERTLTTPYDPTRPSLLIVGDSVAITLDNGIRNVIGPKVSIVGGSELGCALLLSPKAMTFDGKWSKDGTQCPDHDHYWSKLVEAQKPDVVILLVGAWDLYTRDWGNGPVAPGDSEFDQNYSEAIDATLKVLSAKGAEVIVLTTPCFEPGPGERAGPQHDLLRVQRLAQLQREAVDSLNRSEPQPQASILDLQSVTCDNGFTQSRDGVVWRPDGVHFSVDGSQVAARWLVDALPDTAKSRLGLPTQ
jgi:lysophospholipase L1-like esterase